MKGLGLPEDIGMTLIFLVALLVMVLIGFFIFIKIALPGGSEQISYSVVFLSIANRPFLLAEVLSHVQFTDRTLLEQSIESMATGSLEDAQATQLPASIKSFLVPYKLSDYYISLKSDGNEIANADIREFRCGDDLDGWCTYDKCDVGQVEIDAGSNTCLDGTDASQLKRCCKEDTEAYTRTVNKYTIQTCGPQQRGVCSEGVRFIPLFSTPRCPDSRIDYGLVPECNTNSVNSGNTPICCGPKTEENQISTRSITKAVIPLLYRNLIYGTLEVSGR